MDYRVDHEGYDLFIEQEKNNVKQSIINSYISLRKSRGITQQEIAERTGMKRTNIVRIENGKSVPTIEVLVKLASALDMELKVCLVGRDENG